MMPKSVGRRIALRAKVAAAAALLCLAQVFCAFYGSGRSFWLDEAFSAQVAEHPFGEITDVIKRDTAPPAYYLALAAWVRLFGTSERAVRGLSALFVVAAGLVIFFAARSLFSTRAALLCLSVYTVSPLALLTSQLGRMYAMLILLSAASTSLFIRVFFSGGRSRWAEALFVLANAVGLLTHLWFFFLFASEAACWALFSRLKRPARPLVLFTLPLVTYALVWLPSFYEQYLFARGGLAWMWRPTLFELAEVPYWHARVYVLVAPALALFAGAKLRERRLVVLASAVALALAALFAMPELKRVVIFFAWPDVKDGWLAVLATIIALALAFFAAAKLRDRRLAVLASLYALTLLLPFAVSHFKPLFLARYTVVAIPAIILVVGRTLDSAYTRLLPLCCAAVTALSVYGVVRFINNLPPCDDRSTALHLAQQARPGDAVIFSGAGRLPVEYYLERFNPDHGLLLYTYPDSPRAPVLPVPFQDSPAADARALVERVKGEARPGAQVWLFYGAWQPWQPYHGVIKQELGSNYSLAEDRPLRCVSNSWAITLYTRLARYQ